MNRLRLPLILVFAASLFVASGCKPDWPECKSDKHCRVDDDGNEVSYICVDGTCRECVADGDCAAGFECVDFACEPEPECRQDADCPGNQICRNNECTYECTSDAHCGAGMMCQENQCVEDPDYCVRDVDCPEGYECERNRCVEAEPVIDCEAETVHFEFDSHALTANARRVLSENAECLQQLSGRITLEGHADERGTQEYNLALGERRANAARRYLMDLGIPSDRLRTVSYGKERPVDPRSNEDAWERNRRVEFRVQ